MAAVEVTHDRTIRWPVLRFLSPHGAEADKQRLLKPADFEPDDLDGGERSGRRRREAGDNPLVIARARFSLAQARGIAGPGQGGRWRRQSRAPLELGETRSAALIDRLEGAGAEARRREQASGVLILL